MAPIETILEANRRLPPPNRRTMSRLEQRTGPQNIVHPSEDYPLRVEAKMSTLLDGVGAPHSPSSTKLSTSILNQAQPDIPTAVQYARQLRRRSTTGEGVGIGCGVVVAILFLLGCLAYRSRSRKKRLPKKVISKGASSRKTKIKT